MTEIKDSIKESAIEGIKKASGDSGSVEMHSIKDQIEADYHVSKKNASRRGMLGIRRQRAVPPGGV